VTRQQFTTAAVLLSKQKATDIDRSLSLDHSFTTKQWSYSDRSMSCSEVFNSSVFSHPHVLTSVCANFTRFIFSAENRQFFTQQKQRRQAGRIKTNSFQFLVISLHEVRSYRLMNRFIFVVGNAS
jgi:hypothetical protein